MLALVATGRPDSKLELREVQEPAPASGQVLVEVRASSLNRGEVRRLLTAEPGLRPGWDVAGVVVRPAGDGSGPPEGARVVGLVRAGAWAQRVAVSTALCAELPAEVSFAQAAALPVAGLTALRALALGGLLLGRRVLVTGAAGGVGRMAIQLAARSGAHVTGVVGRPERGEGLRRLGASELVLAFEPSGPPCDLILESVGGSSLAAAFSRVAPGGLIVSFGNSSGEPTTFNASELYGRGGARLCAFLVFAELAREPSGVRDLATLARLVAEHALDPQVTLETSWRDARGALDALLERRVAGKAVLHLE